MRNRRGAARRGVGFSLFALISMSTILSFANLIAAPKTAQAVTNGDLTVQENQDIRILKYFKQCLQDRLDTDGNDGNGKNKEFESWWEVFKNDSNSNETQDGKDVIAVGTDLDSKSGMMSCEEIAQKAVSIYQPSRAADYREYLQEELWGRVVTASTPLKVDGKKVRARADSIINNRLNGAISRREKAGSARKANLARFAPLIEQCFKNWSSEDFPGKIPDQGDALSFPGRKVFAERQRFDWKNISSVTAFRAVNGDFTGTTEDAFLGDIKLNWRANGLAADFNDRTSNWFPIGNDLGKSVIGGDYQRFDKQTFLDCNWVKDHSDYLFSRDKQYKYYFTVKNGKLTMVDQNDKEVEDVDLGGGDTTASSGSNNYQCIVAPPLSWIACPIVTLVVKAVDFLEGAIIQALEVPPLSTGGEFAGLHAAWAGFRDVANAFLVIIFLITIFAQVLPLDVDPYMIKKLLPKLIAAAIFIQFSYFFVQIMFDISRVLAQGIETLIQSIPVGDVNGGVFGQSAGNSTATSALGLLGGIAVGTAGAAAAFTAGTALIVPVLLLLLAGLISVVTLFITLQMRMIIIIIMTILAPLAFLAWILPNTENYFKKWITGLIKLLLMYPIIVFMVTSVNLISSISYGALQAMSGSEKGVAGGASDITKIMISIIPIVVYFMIPMTFKWAGGIFATLSGAIQSQGGRLSKRSMRAAGKSLGEAKHKAGEALKDTGPLTRGDMKSPTKMFRRFGARTASGNIFSFGDVGRRKIKQAEQHAYSAVAESIQDTLRGKNNKKLLEEDFAEALEKGELTRATAIGDLILQQGGDLEMEKYFRELEWVGGKVGGMKTGKVTRNSETGAVEQVDDPIWQQLTKLHGASLASKLPHTVGKPILQASPDQMINSKGQHPAWELQQEIKAQRAIVDEENHEVAGSDAWKAVEARKEKAKAKLIRAANNFYTASQRENASEMGDDMVRTWQEVADDIDDLGLEFGGVGAKEFIERQTAGGSLKRYVQGTPPAGSPPVPPTPPAAPPTPPAAPTPPTTTP